ncbi:MAG: AAA family ATPase, partial [Longispora sp.]|nr:AAA family ATPase [Longispora sp. (in: high G+C Gram-positive bacteria)]
MPGWEVVGDSTPVGRYHADLHIHSKYSRACSKDADLENLAWWARRKGIALLGTGDFTHPAWNQHLNDNLVEAEPGLFTLSPEIDRSVNQKLSKTLRGQTRFMLSVEISTIYKRDGKTRKVHHLVYMPDLDAASRFNTALGRIGNLGSDGRPILGLDSRDLLDVVLHTSPDAYLIPAHIWTPWFSVLGSKSGFDQISDCYAELTAHVFAAETGLSSNPEMNSRVSSLDPYTLVSNSDAHSPPNLGRELTTFSAPLDYYAIREALRTRVGYEGTLEFFPEEGKYHADGHRACDVIYSPAETLAANSICPVCGKSLTVGVLSRIGALADRSARPAPETTSIIPLPEILSELEHLGPKTKRVTARVDSLVAELGPEIDIL